MKCWYDCHHTILRLLSSAATASVWWRVRELNCPTTYVPPASHPKQHCCENLASHTLYLFFSKNLVFQSDFCPNKIPYQVIFCIYYVRDRGWETARIANKEVSDEWRGFVKLCSHLPCAKPRCVTVAHSGCGKLAFYTIFVGVYCHLEGAHCLSHHGWKIMSKFWHFADLGSNHQTKGYPESLNGTEESHCHLMNHSWIGKCVGEL